MTTSARRLNVSITDSETLEKLDAYSEELGLSYASTMRLAMKRELPELPSERAIKRAVKEVSGK